MQQPQRPPTIIHQVGNRPDEVYVSFSAEVTPQPAEALIAAMANLANQGVPKVHLLLSTPGGSVMHGITVYNTLRGMPFELVTHNVGNVNSIGNPIFLAGEKRYACKHSTFMFHGVGFNAPPNMRMEEKFLRERLDGLDADQKRIASIIAERTNLTDEEIAGMFLEAQTRDAEYALKAGIVHEIRDVNIPHGHPVQALVFQRQGGVGS
jgi:ATP-dependent Clp protease, protease subunit